jgi:outer membrane protein
MKSILLAAAAVATVAAAAPAHAEQGDVLLRARAIVVAPTEDSGGVEPAFPNDGVSVTNSFAPEVDVTYFVTGHIGLELIAATTKHDVKGKGGLEPLDELVDTWVLPPTLTLQYHFTPRARIRPYVGVGLNYTHFYSEDASDGLEAAIGETKVKLKDSFGYALQAGLDVDVGKNLFLNFDVKYIDIDTKATLTTGGLTNRVKVSLDPIVAGVGVGMRF